jgi:predicted phosphodiesterase
MKIGLLTDLHLGHTGTGCWHNRLMFNQAESITRASIAVLNAQALDVVFVLGDITAYSQPGQLPLAYDVLSTLSAPWYVVPGNHDRGIVQNGQFDVVFAQHAAPPYMRLGDIGVASLRERVPADLHDDICYPPDDSWIQHVLQGITADCSHTLVVLSHFPLHSEQAWAEQHQGKDAGQMRDGEALFTRLKESLRPGCPARERRIILLCGHEHWHHVTQNHDYVQCVTASLIEYPMEVRVVTLAEDSLRISTLSVPVEAIANQSIASADAPAPWVRGRVQDREYVLQSLHRGDQDHEQN